MNDLIGAIFEILANAFDKIPLLDKLKGWRSVIGFVGLAVVAVLQKLGLGSVELLSGLKLGFEGFIALALNAKNNAN